jgi:hypothetical protein
VPVNPTTGMPQPGNPYQGAPLPYDNSKSLAKHAYQSAVSALRDQRRDTTNYYGFRANGRVDPHNTYGAWQMLGREQGQQMTDLSNAQQQAGLSGFGTGPQRGLARQQSNQALFAHGAQSKQMLTEFQDKMQAIRLGFREAGWQRRNTETSGTLQAILNAIAAGQFTPAAPSRY